MATNTIAAVAVSSAPAPFSTALGAQPRGRSRYQWRSRPVWLMVNPMNTPIA